MQSLKLLVALLVCTVFIFSFSHVGAMVTNEWLPHTKSFSEETLIATEEVSNTSKAEAMEKLEAAKNKWLTNGTIFLEWTGELQPFPKDAFTFYITESIEYAVDGTTNGLKVELPNSVWLEQIEMLTKSTDIFSNLDTEKLKLDLEEVASHLKEENHTLSLADYLVDQTIIEQTSNQASINLSGSATVTELKEVLDNKEVVLQGNQMFSLNAWILEEDLTLSDEAASTVASLLYQLLAPTNFQVMERHISNDLPEWAPLGYEAHVQKERMDFVLFNPNQSEYQVALSVDAQSLLGTFTGGPMPYTYTIIEEKRENLTPKTIVQYSALLGTNQKNVKDTGKDGAYIYLVREATDHTGAVIESTPFSEDYYAPMQRVEVHSLTVPVVAANPNTDGNNGNENYDGTTNPNTNPTTTTPGGNTNNTGTNSGTTTGVNPGTTPTNTTGTSGNQNTNTGGNTSGQNNSGTTTGTGNSNSDDDSNSDRGPGKKADDSGK